MSRDADEVRVPAGVAALGPDVEARLTELVADARRRQSAELSRALDDTLRIVPRPLRLVVRRIVGGTG